MENLSQKEYSLPLVSDSPYMDTKIPTRSAEDYDSESISLLEDYERSIQPHRHKRQWIHWAAHIVAIILCLGLSLYAVKLHQSLPKHCLEKFNSYSPILEALDEDDYQDIRFKYSLWYKSPFKGPPTPQVEEAWYNIMKYGLISVPASDILRIGHNLSSVQFPPSAGGGYVAIASGTHALHCLHYIWQDHHSELIPEVKANKAEIPEMYERHYEHCVDYTRQYIMCKFDTTILPMNWVRDHQNPTPNGNTIHKCVNWDSLQMWLEQRAVEMPEGFKWSQPADAVVLDENP